MTKNEVKLSIYIGFIYMVVSSFMALTGCVMSIMYFAGSDIPIIMKIIEYIFYGVLGAAFAFMGFIAVAYREEVMNEINGWFK